MNEKSISMGEKVQIAFLVNILAEPKWEVVKSKEMARLNGAWDEKWELKEKNKVLARINEFQDDLLHVIKTELSQGINNAWKKKKKLPKTFATNLIALGSIGTLGTENLLKNRDILDDTFVQEIVEIATKSEFSEEAAFALLGLELAFRDGSLIPVILEIFDKTFSLRLARYLGKITWDDSVVDSLVKATRSAFLYSIPDGLKTKLVDGVGLLASLSLIELKNENGLRGMVLNLLHNQELNYTPKLLIQAGDIVVPYLIQGLELKDSNARSQAAFCLGEIGNKAATISLIKAIEDEDSSFVSRVAKALGKLKDPRAISALLVNINHKSILVRPVVNWALNNLKDQFRSEPFIAALNNTDDKVVLYAINVLSKLGSESSIEALSKLLNSQNRKISKAAEKAIKQINKMIK